MPHPLECASVTSSSSAIQTDCSVHCWKTQGNGKQTEMCTSLGHCTFKAANHNKIQSFVQGRSSFPYPSRCSFARPTLVAAKKKRRSWLSLGNQRSAYALLVRYWRLGCAVGRPQATRLWLREQILVYLPHARCAVGARSTASNRQIQ